MRLLELFCDDRIGPFCLVEYVLEADNAFEFIARTVLFVVLCLPMFCVVAPFWMAYQVGKNL
jgi:hypothetical protein